MTIEEVMQAEGAFLGALPELALRKHAKQAVSKSNWQEEASKVIFEVEIRPYDEKYVHIEAYTLSEHVATKRPIRRDYLLAALQQMGTYLAEMEWTRIVQE